MKASPNILYKITTLEKMYLFALIERACLLSKYRQPENFVSLFGIFLFYTKATHFDASECLFLDGWYKYANFNCRYRRYILILTRPSIPKYISRKV